MKGTPVRRPGFFIGEKSQNGRKTNGSRQVTEDKRSRSAERKQKRGILHIHRINKSPSRSNAVLKPMFNSVAYLYSLMR